MRVWAVAYDRTTGRRLQGPINLLNARVTRALDGIGSFSLQTELLSDRARNLLTNETKVEIWTELNLIPRLVGTGIITNVNKAVSGGQFKLEASGPDVLQELKRKSTFLNRRYDDTLEDIADDLTSLAGWVAITTGTWPGISIRFDGQSVMSAILTAAKAVGAHVRQGAAPNQLEVGAFGDDLSLFVTNQVYNSGQVELNDRLALIDSVVVGDSSEAVATVLCPLGGGEGEAALTLAKSTRPGILSALGSSGEPYYYIENAAGIANFNRIEDTRTFKEITPIANDDASQVAAANNLFDVASAWLERYAQKVTTYQLRVKKLNTLVRPGDRIRVVYTGIAQVEGGDDVFLEVDEFFYVMRITEDLNTDPSATIEVSSVDRYLDTAVSMVADNIKEAQVLGLKPLPTATMFSSQVIRPFSALRGVYGGNFFFWFRINDLLADVTTVLIDIRTEPLEATTRGPLTAQTAAAATQVDLALTKGLTYPEDVHLYINNVDVSSQYGGPWPGGGAGSLIVNDLNVTELLRSAGFKNTHKIGLTCGQVSASNPLPGYVTATQGEDSSGMGIVTVHLLGTTQAIR